MKLLQENNEFGPISIVLETSEEAQVFWNMVDRVKKKSYKDAEYKMARTISSWLFLEARL